MNEDTLTVEAKHIFLDVVSYTYNRSVEAQTDLIEILNAIVKESISAFNLNDDHLIFIPTGDGICISIINTTNPYDIHLNIALEILKRLGIHNENVQSEMRKFKIRVAINENIDNLITDINGNKNISGFGINCASRILSLCDPNQIIVGNTVYEKLVQREKYMNSFSTYTGNVKHNLSLRVHQYLNKDFHFLNNDIPHIFKPEEKIIKKLPTILAYYMALCISNEDFIIKNLKGDAQDAYSLRVLFFQLAEDYFEKSKVTKIKPQYRIKVSRNLEEQFEYLQSLDYWIVCDLSNYMVDKIFSDFGQYFDDQYLFVNEDGKTKLQSDFGPIYIEFCLNIKNV
jgi:hypothetical protein